MITRNLFFMTLATLVCIFKVNAQTNYSAPATSIGGIWNTFLGVSAGNATSGQANTFVGFNSGQNIVSGTENVFLGSYTGYNTSTGSDNVFIGGRYSGYDNISGNKNIFIGSFSGQYNTTGTDNTFSGDRSGWYNTTGSRNTFLGKSSGTANSTGNDNISIGATGPNNGNFNILIGASSGNNITSEKNIMIGYDCGQNITTGQMNTFIGSVLVPSTIETATQAGYNTNGTIILADGGGNQKLFIDNRGFVGIGLGSNVIPQNRLEVDAAGGVSGTSGLRFRNFTNTNFTTTATSTKRVLSVNGDGDVILVDDALGKPTLDPSNGAYWGLTGNAGTNPSLLSGFSSFDLPTIATSNFIGTTNSKDVVFRRNNILGGRIGTTNTALGQAALSSHTGDDGENTAIGGQALVGNKNLRNTAIGYSSLGLSVNGRDNVAIGHRAGIVSGNGQGNIYIGVNSGPVPVIPTPLTAIDENYKLYINSSVNTYSPRPLIGGDFIDRNVTFDVSNSVSPTSKVTIYGGNSASGVTGKSGLLFSALTSANTAGISNGKVLSVDAGGNVVLQTDLNLSIYSHDGTLDTTTVPSTTSGVRTVTMGNNNLFFKTNGSFEDETTGTGRIYIGTSTLFPTLTTTPNNSHYRLLVEGGILTEKVKVALRFSGSDWADYVFADDYKLMPLKEVEAFVKQNNHLPGIESAKELVKNGLDLGVMQAKQMEKIEELTLYAIEQNKKLEIQSKEIDELKAQMKVLMEKK